MFLLEKVNTKVETHEKTIEIPVYDYREGKVKHYYEITYDENGIIVIKSIDSDDVLAISVKYSGLRQDMRRLNEILAIQEQKLMASDIKDKRVYKIYKITFPNGKVYIGQTIQMIEDRFRQELTSAYTKGSKEYDYPLSRALRKYLGEDLTLDEAFKQSKKLGIFPELWHVCADQQDANNAEKFWIGYYHSQFDEYGYNILEGGEGVPREKTIIPADAIEDAFEDNLFIKNKLIVKENILRYLNEYKDYYDIDYEITNHILSNSLKYHYGESMTFEKMKWDKIKNKLRPYLEKGYNVYEIKSELGLKENVETIKNWIKNIVLETDLNSLDIIIPNLIRENLLKGKPDYTKILTRLPSVQYNNRKEWIKIIIEKLPQKTFNHYLKNVLVGLLEDIYSKKEINTMIENMIFPESIFNPEDINMILEELDEDKIKFNYLGRI